MRRARRIAAWAALALLMLPAAARPQVPRTMHFQGVLTGDDGLPVTGTVPMIFRLYADTTEAAIWSQSLPAMQVKNGWYEAELDVTALPFDVPYYLQIVVSGTPLGPKKPLASVPYAMRSAHTRVTAGAGLAGSSDSAGVRIDLANAGVTSAKLADGSVTAAKLASGAVSGEKVADLAIGPAKITDGAVTGPKIAPDQVVRRINGLRDNVYLQPGSNVTMAVQDSVIQISATAGGGAADADWQVSGDWMYALPAGNVGIGTAAPASKLEVKGGDARITNGSVIIAPVGGAPPLNVSSSALVANLNADMVDGLHAMNFALSLHEHDASAITTGTIGFARLPVGTLAGTVAEGNHTHPGGDGDWTVDGSDMYSAVGGNVGIGTDAPTRTFDVQGDVEVTGAIYAGDATGLGIRDHGGTIGLWVEDGGEVGIGTSAAGATFDVNGTAIVRGALFVGGDNFDDNDTLGMDDETKLLLWDDAADRFELTKRLSVRGAVSTGDFADQVASVPYNNFTFGTVLTPTSGEMNSSGDLYVQFDCEVGDQLFVDNTAEVAEDLVVGSSAAIGDSLDVGTDLSVGHDVSVGDFAATDNDAIFFDQRGEHLTWDNAQTRFELSRSLSVGEPLAAGGPNALLGAKRAYNYFSYSLTPSPGSGEMVTGGDLFVDWDFEAGDDIYYSGSIVDLAPGIPLQGGGSVEDLDLSAAKQALGVLRPKVIRTEDKKEGKSGGEKAKIGFLASDLPELLKTGSNNGYRPLDIVAILTKIVQEQQATIASLEARVQALEREGSAR